MKPCPKGAKFVTTLVENVGGVMCTFGHTWHTSWHRAIARLSGARCSTCVLIQLLSQQMKVKKPSFALSGTRLAKSNIEI